MSWTTILNKDELKRAIIDGDEKAFGHFYEATKRNLYGAISNYIADPDIIKDIMQSAYLKIWDRRGQLDSIEDLGGYLYIIARNASFDYLRFVARDNKYMKSLSDRPPVIQNEIEKTLVGRETRHSLLRAVNKLPPKQRQAFTLLYERQLSYKEIAKEMNISPLTVKKHLSDARQFLRDFYRQNLHLIMIMVTKAIQYFHIS